MDFKSVRPTGATVKIDWSLNNISRLVLKMTGNILRRNLIKCPNILRQLELVSLQKDFSDDVKSER